MPSTPCQKRRARSGSSAGNSISGAGTGAWISVVVSHLEDLFAAHLADHLRMGLADVLLDLADELVLRLGLDVVPAFAMDDLGHHSSFVAFAPRPYLGGRRSVGGGVIERWPGGAACTPLVGKPQNRE